MIDAQNEITFNDEYVHITRRLTAAANPGKLTLLLITQTHNHHDQLLYFTCTRKYHL